MFWKPKCFVGNIFQKLLFSSISSSWMGMHKIGEPKIVEKLVFRIKYKPYFVLWSNSPVVRALNFQCSGPEFMNRRVNRRPVQPFILPRPIKWVSETPKDLLIKSKLSLRSGSLTFSQVNSIHRKGACFFFSMKIT